MDDKFETVEEYIETKYRRAVKNTLLGVKDASWNLHSEAAINMLTDKIVENLMKERTIK